MCILAVYFLVFGISFLSFVVLGVLGTEKFIIETIVQKLLSFSREWSTAITFQLIMSILLGASMNIVFARSI